MIETVFDTEGLPAADRWESWYDISTKSHVPTSIRVSRQDGFHGTARILDLGTVQVSTLTFSPLTAARTAKLIRRSDPGAYQLVLPLRGRIGVAQSGRQASLGTRDLVLYDTSRPYNGWAHADTGTGTVTIIVVQIPRQCLPVRGDALDGVTAVRYPGRDGLGALLSRHLIELTRQAAWYTTADAARLATVTVDLLGALCAHELSAAGTGPARGDRCTLQALIHDFIERRLADPGLCPGAIAAAHGISTRYLHALFQQQGLTVAGWTRTRRLERCRHDLADPRLSHHPIHAIAGRWGFTDGAHFSRVFRAAYGIPPSEYRHLAR